MRLRMFWTLRWTMTICILRARSSSVFAFWELMKFAASSTYDSNCCENSMEVERALSRKSSKAGPWSCRAAANVRSSLELETCRSAAMRSRTISSTRGSSLFADSLFCASVAALACCRAAFAIKSSTNWRRGSSSSFEEAIPRRHSSNSRPPSVAARRMSWRRSRARARCVVLTKPRTKEMAPASFESPEERSKRRFAVASNCMPPLARSTSVFATSSSASSNSGAVSRTSVRSKSIAASWSASGFSNR
mmetsp:Transcript_10090/g.33330  ORF Transcript_10090/g.33330 Transcript_10090/m.33330 type:complete len:249 (-) Transcript_10090:462-1208(-)